MASRPYQAQVAPGGTQPLGQASAQAFGAGVGDAITAVGEAAERYDHVQRQLQRNEENAAFGKAFSDYRLSATRDIQGYQQNAQGGAAGHEDSVRNYLDTNGNALLAGIADRHIREQAEVQVREFNNATLGREAQWAGAQRVAKLGLDEKDAQGTDALRFSTARTIDDVSAFGIENDSAALARIAAYENLNDDQRSGLIREHYRSQDDAKLAAVLRISPAGAKQMVAAGAFPALDGDHAERAMLQADAAIARAEAAKRADEAHARAVLKDELGAVEVTLNAGGGNVADRLGLADRYEKLGDKSKAAYWRDKAGSFKAAQGSSDWTLPQLDARIATLTAKRNGGHLSGAEASELSGLTDTRSAVAGQLGQPGGALLNLQYATGRALAPIDPSDAAGMQARGRDATVAAQRAGRGAVEPILPTELPAFKDMIGTPTGKLQALDAIQAFGTPAAIAGAARQIAGADDGDFRIAATLDRQAARDVLRGGETLRGNASVWNDKQAGLVMQQHYRRTLGWLGEGYANDVFAAAKNLYAERMTRAGETKWNPGRFAEAIEAAMGRTKAADGTYRGGVARTPRGIVVVPPGMAPGQLLDRFARAAPRDYTRASGGRHPVWADGKPLTEGQFKSMLLPTALGNGRYGFRAPGGGLIQDDKGHDYSVDPGALGR